MLATHLEWADTAQHVFKAMHRKERSVALTSVRAAHPTQVVALKKIFSGADGSEEGVRDAA